MNTVENIVQTYSDGNKILKKTDQINLWFINYELKN